MTPFQVTSAMKKKKVGNGNRKRELLTRKGAELRFLPWVACHQHWYLHEWGLGQEISVGRTHKGNSLTKVMQRLMQDMSIYTQCEDFLGWLMKPNTGVFTDSQGNRSTERLNGVSRGHTTNLRAEFEYDSESVACVSNQNHSNC